MTVSLVKTSFASGELSPSYWGRADEAKWQVGASVFRNGFVNFRGGYASRAGFAFVGRCKQPGLSAPPRAITFTLNIFQDYILEFGDQYMRVVFDGAYVTETPIAIIGATNAVALQLSIATNTFIPGDYLYVSGVGGMTQINNRIFIVLSVTGSLVTVGDIFSNTINSLGYGAFTSGGTAARIYTVPSPYEAVDLGYLKFTQSADVMSLTCVNQQTNVEYPPYDLELIAPNNWQFIETTYTESIGPPGTCSAVATATTSSNATQYAYCVTAVDQVTGEESIASLTAYAVNSVDIALTEGSITITWAPVQGAAYYNIYKAPPSVLTSVPIGSVFGYAGTAYGNQFVDSNIVQDATTTPPLHLNPFARGTVLNVVVTAQGSGYTQTTTTATINSVTGSEAVVIPVVVSGSVVALIVVNPGQDYQPGDPVSATDSGMSPGSGFAGYVTVGPESGTYPGLVAYFQERRVYGQTLNNPDTLFFSQTGAFTNMDSSTPPADSDAIIATPWGQQVNALQWLIPMPGGLVVLTGLDAWQVSGTSGPGSAVTPSQIAAQPQESNGTSPTVLPLRVNYDIIYLQALQSVVRDLEYNFFVNIYAGQDISLFSNHLFEGYSIVQWAWAREPNKLIWAVRNDGKMLSQTYVKEQKVAGWARHDTNGLFVSVTSASEPPVDAVYVIVQRYIVGERQWMYYLERMDNRLWNGAEDPWCVDCGLSLDQPEPDAILYPSAATGPGTLQYPNVVNGGANYSANPSIKVFDPSNPNVTGTAVATVVDGVIQSFTISGSGFVNLKILVSDATGSGAVLTASINNEVLFVASEPVFSSQDVGSIIRVDGGKANIASYISPTQVTATILAPLVLTMPNDPNNLPVPASSGQWTMTAPVSVLTNLDFLNGMVVNALVDGNVVLGLTVENGSVTLPFAGTSIKIGLPFTAQLQAMHTDVPGGQTVQDKSKRVSAVTVRQDRSRGISVGANQPIAAATQFQAETPWTNMQELHDRTTAMKFSQDIPLITGDDRITIPDVWQQTAGQKSYGMIAAEQNNPLPMNIVEFLYEVEIGAP